MSWSKAANKRWRDKYKAKHGIAYGTVWGRKERAAGRRSLRCLFCKKHFMPKRWDRGYYCYKLECIKRYHVERSRKNRAIKKANSVPKPKRKYQCSECFTYKYTHNPKAVTCSRKCKGARYWRLIKQRRSME